MCGRLAVVAIAGPVCVAVTSQLQISSKRDTHTKCVVQVLENVPSSIPVHAAGVQQVLRKYAQ